MQWQGPLGFGLTLCFLKGGHLKGRREWVDDDPRETGCFFLRLMGWYQVEVAVYVVYVCICMYVHLMVCSGLCCAVLAMCVLGGEYGEREGRRDGGTDGWMDVSIEGRMDERTVCM